VSLFARDRTEEWGSETPTSDGVIGLRGVVKDYAGPPAVRALHGVSLQIAGGELAAILGPSGSGKSTLLHIMGTLDRATAGQVRIAGRDVATLSDAQLSALRARSIGFVFQEFFLLEAETALDNVADGLLYTGIPARDRRLMAGDALERVGLGHRIDHPATKLSGGERQRVAVARAIVGRPAIVLADEPTGNLDSRSSEEIVELLEDLNRDGITIVVITHNLEVADRFPRRISIRDGRIERGATAALPPQVPVAAHPGTSHRRGRGAMTGDLISSRLHPTDAVRTATVGLRTRRTRSLLSALGILIGIAAMIAVLGLSESSKSDLLAQLDRLGTNLLRVQASEGLGLGSAELPETALAMTARIDGVERVSAQVDVAANVFRTGYIPPTRTGGLTVKAVDTGILGTLKGMVAEGRFLDAATARYPVTVLGSLAAERLGIRDLSEQPRVWLGNQWFSVIGILNTLDLNPDLDRSAIIGIPAAQAYLGSDGVASTIFVRTAPGSVDAVLGLLASTVNPENPDQVEASRPTEAIEARAAAASAFTELLLGLGAVALLVGAVGIANIMVISVLERRSEIGLRRALGATKRHIAVQFLTESLLLAAIGGAAGVVTGGLITMAYARIRGWGVILPAPYLGAGIATALVIGALAGLYPALRASRMSPTEALRTV